MPQTGVFLQKGPALLLPILLAQHLSKPIQLLQLNLFNILGESLLKTEPGEHHTDRQNQHHHQEDGKE
jgi:hypothetical protein